MMTGWGKVPDHLRFDSQPPDRVESVIPEPIKQAILSDTRKAYDIAMEYGLTLRSVHKVRSEAGVSLPRGKQAQKLTENDVKRIYTDRRAFRDIAFDYGIDRSMVGKIKNGRCWARITKDLSC